MLNFKSRSQSGRCEVYEFLVYTVLDDIIYYVYTVKIKFKIFILQSCLFKYNVYLFQNFKLLPFRNTEYFVCVCFFFFRMKTVKSIILCR